MTQTIGYIRGPGKRRRSPNGKYVECRTGFLGMRRCKGCRACGGDGMRKVGTKRRGRNLGRGRQRKPRGAVKRGAWRLGIGGAVIATGNARFGTIGGVLAAVLVLVWLTLTLLAWLAAEPAGHRGAKRKRRRRTRRR